MHLNSSTALITKSARLEKPQCTLPFKQSKQIASSHSRVSRPQISKEQRPVNLATRVAVANRDTAGVHEKPRVRKYHELSEGESDSDNPQVLHRALRPDENPARGLRAPYGHDPAITGQAHVAAGSRSKKKSRYVSASRSIKPPAAWQSPGGLVVTFRRPSNGKVYDLTRLEDRKKIFDQPNGRIANFAKASQEVIFTGFVPPEDILKVYKVVEESNPQNYRSVRLNPYMKAVRTRRKAGEEPRRLVLLAQTARFAVGSAR